MKVKLLGWSLFCLMILSSLMISITAQDKPYYPYGGGIVYGRIQGFNYYNELIPIAWATVSGWQDEELVNYAYSMGGGYYELVLPVGWYTLTVEEPGFVSFSREIFVSSGSASAINVFLELSGKPVYKPKLKPPEPAQYTVQIVVTELPSDLTSQVYVNDVFRDEIAEGEKLELSFDLDTSHTISVKELIERNGERYVVDESGIIVSKATMHEFKYRGEYLLKFITEPEGFTLPFELQTGWYPEGETLSTPEAPALIEESSRVQYRFKSWMLNDEMVQGSMIKFVMDQPITVKVVYTPEYLVEVSSVYGTPEGAGWYSAGSTATISIQPREGFLVRRVFIGWHGDYIGKDHTVTFPVNKPMQISAIWTTDYIQLLLIIVIIVIGIAAVLIVASIRRKSSHGEHPTKA